MNTNQNNQKSITKVIHQNNRYIDQITSHKKYPQNNALSIFQNFIGGNSKQDNYEIPYFQPPTEQRSKKGHYAKQRASFSSQYFCNDSNTQNKVNCNVSHSGILRMKSTDLNKDLEEQVVFTPIQKKVHSPQPESLLQHQNLSYQSSLQNQNNQALNQQKYGSQNISQQPSYMERKSSTPIIKERFIPNDQKYKDLSSIQVFQAPKETIQISKDSLNLPKLDQSHSSINLQKKSVIQNGQQGNQDLNQCSQSSQDKSYSKNTPINIHRKYNLVSNNSDYSTSVQKKSDITDDHNPSFNKASQYIIESQNKISDEKKSFGRKSEGEIDLNNIQNKYAKPLSKVVKEGQNLNTSSKQNINNHFLELNQNRFLIQKQDSKKPNSSLYHIKNSIDSSQKNILNAQTTKNQGNSQNILNFSSTSTNQQYSSSIRSQSVQINTLQQIKQKNEIATSSNNKMNIKFELNNNNNILQQQPTIQSARELEQKENKIIESFKQNITAANESHGMYKGFIYDQKGNIKTFDIICQTKTRAGQYSPNLKKINQDSYIVIPYFPNDKTYSLFGVCDGHGEYGHLASNFVKKNLPKVIQRVIKSQGGWQNNDINLQKIITKSFQTVSNDLLNSKVDTFMSGTTVVSVLIHNNTLWCSNCGDSRAILGRELGKGSKSEWKSIPLSEDHKPDLPREKKRILEHGGKVEKSRDENGVAGGIYRIWNQTMEGPGLAMARSLGDKAGREVGVISDPDIYEVLIKEEDRFIVIASDGVWEFLTNQDVIFYEQCYVFFYYIILNRQLKQQFLFINKTILLEQQMLQSNNQCLCGKKMMKM
ncbi:protein phosphatase 2C containing protein (macronuclear) [Tetrahymena thermophila SB210]|uniref:Protein phosphatase 2C containing protein n=1 Tax=Tetrahymena thermophila (strain SB210) TaxID=312017 RepID=I7MCW9_TETTS|nr:protein phosphatase 2C containing protein [Tetrahymena thermophila SB210]EAR85071.2 protein phosphatase 2C containing protein [Tetrahymena thermophila SB210]|eukprot:XP_001032734.2 protein phosphatase 2C containing protein [Tetrahymena thermophila SB210]